MQPADWDAGYALTLQSALRLVSAALPGMRARRWGRIVALESVTVKQPIPALVLSNAFRGAVAAALKSLASEVAAEGITVNTIATGFVLTDRFRKLYGTAEKMAAALANVPMGRAATPQEFAPLVVAFQVAGIPDSNLSSRTTVDPAGGGTSSITRSPVA